MSGLETTPVQEEIVQSLVRVNSRSSSGCSSADSHSTESVRSPRNKQKNGNNKTLAVVNDLKTGTVTIHVPNARSVSAFNGSHASSGGLHISSGGSHTSSGTSHLSSGGSHGSSAGSRASSELSSSTLLCDNLQQELDTLKKELKVAHLTISNLQEREAQMKCRLAEQAQKMLERGVRFENVSLGEKRPTALIRKFGNLYAQSRVDTLDALDELLPLQNSDQLKTKILFSVIVLAFRSVQNTISDIKLNLRSLLQVRDYAFTDPTLKELDNGVAIYLRRTADTFNLTKNINDVCAQIYATLYDYPCLKECPGLIKYVKECVRIAWGLTNQNPPYVIEYETRVFKREHHLRFHTSNSTSDAIKNYMWPVLLEGENGPCVYKGVVIT